MTRIMGVTGWSGAGKTTLIRQLIPRLAAAGVSVSTIKHAHHRFDVDQPGKDSWLHREAGAQQVLVASEHRWALMTEQRGAPEPTLAGLLARLDPVDLVLVEGYKRDSHPKLEVWRAANGKPALFAEDPSIVALATDAAVAGAGVPVLPLDDIDAIAGVVIAKAAPVAAVRLAGSQADRQSAHIGGQA